MRFYAQIVLGYLFFFNTVGVSLDHAIRPSSSQEEQMQTASEARLEQSIGLVVNSSDCNLIGNKGKGWKR